tara:strand:- start:4890 stop:5858 length:969 start_codon:yes stop_codon:yes gene_type:complete
MLNYAFEEIIMQITNNIMMIRPVSFKYNKETSVNNYYQKTLDLDDNQIQSKALIEFDNFVNKLRNVGVNVFVFHDSLHPHTPDSIFPNNWVSFHDNGTVGLYPMYAVNRRNERRSDILDLLTSKYNFSINRIEDFTSFEKDHQFLEGTGSMVLDRENKISYVALSKRSDKSIVEKFCQTFGFSSVIFKAYQNIENKRLEIYHTNVMMCIAENFAVICLDAIDDKLEKQNVIDSLKQTGKDIIEISEQQKEFFAGNMLQVIGDKKYLVMSTTAYNSLNFDQIKKINYYCAILHSSLKIIESCGGGSARCMMAEIFLPKNDDSK